MKCIQCGDEAGRGLLRNGPGEPLCAVCFDAGPNECTDIYHAFDHDSEVCRCGADTWVNEEAQ